MSEDAKTDAKHAFLIAFLSLSITLLLGMGLALAVEASSSTDKSLKDLADAVKIVYGLFVIIFGAVAICTFIAFVLMCLQNMRRQLIDDIKTELG